ncbi:MAG: sterol-binding protein, partial [Actinobacteria bacterium]|nr:sterol-binding protein [Actinomycetota bacterium]
DRLAAHGGRPGFDRSLSCTLPDLGIAFGGRLAAGQLVEIACAESRAAVSAQIRLTMSSNDLLALVDGGLKFGAAWASGRVRIDAGVRDLLRLRALL